MSGNPDRKVRFLPNPNEEVPPPTARDAVEDTFRYLASLSSRDEVRQFAETMDSSRIVSAVQGRIVDRPLEGMELMFGNTIDYCVREGLLSSPIQAVVTLEAVRFDLVHRDIVGFVGQDTPPR